MGRTKPKTKQRSKQKAEPTKKFGPAPTLEALFEKAQELIVQCDYELALRFVRRILEQDSSNVAAKEMLGIALLETGEVEEAKQVSTHIYLVECVSIKGTRPSYL